MGGLLRRPTWTEEESEVIADWIAHDSRTRPLGRLFRCPLCCYNRICPILSYVFFTSFGLVTLVLLAFFSVVIVRPHLYVRQFVKGSCETTSARYTGSVETCSCGPDCETQYPCLEIKIRLVTMEREEHNTCLYYSPSELQQGGCSYRPNCETYHLMSREISRYERKFAPIGQIYPCLYNPYNRKEVVKRIHTLDDEKVISVILWPVVAALTCLMYLLITYLICGCKPYVCVRHPPSDVKLEAKRREELKRLQEQNKTERTHLKDINQSDPSTQRDNYQSGGSLLHEPSELQAIIDKAS